MKNKTVFSDTHHCMHVHNAVKA